MFLFRRAILAPTLAVAVSALLGLGAAQAETAYAAVEEMPGVASGSGQSARPTALSASDRISYTTAFDALRRGDLEAARTAARQAHDRVLLGQVEFERMFHPDYAATYEELTAWLTDYSDLPSAERVYTLAMRRRPDGAVEPTRPAGLLGRTWNSVVSAVSGGHAADPMKAARIALNAEDLNGAVTLGQEIGDWWVVGLAQYRLNQFNESFHAFSRVANDPTEDPWVRSGAAFWTARAAAQAGRQDQITSYLQLAGQWPATFYGQIALRQLGQEPTIENQGPRPYQAEPIQRAVYSPAQDGVDAGALSAFVQSDVRARRTLAFYEVGRRSDAESELRTGIRTAPRENAGMWTALARMMTFGGGGAEASRIDATRYPMPVLEPEGGFTIERALVYALARKETDFNAQARSSVGAYGMMQVMPTTAAELSGDRSFVSDPTKLFAPAVNMRLGQAYIIRMMQIPSFQGDLLKAVASYNAGPGPMLGAIRKLGANADPLLLIETIDVPQARDYVEKVVASYWIYQRLFGGPLNTLDALASGATSVPLSLDYTPPPPAPVDIALVATPAGGR